MSQVFLGTDVARGLFWTNNISVVKCVVVSVHLSGLGRDAPDRKIMCGHWSIQSD